MVLKSTIHAKNKERSIETPCLMKNLKSNTIVLVNHPIVGDKFDGTVINSDGGYPVGSYITDFALRLWEPFYGKVILEFE